MRSAQGLSNPAQQPRHGLFDQVQRVFVVAQGSGTSPAVDRGSAQSINSTSSALAPAGRGHSNRVYCFCEDTLS